MMHQMPAIELLLRGIDAEAKRWAECREIENWLKATAIIFPEPFRKRSQEIVTRMVTKAFAEGFYAGAMAAATGKETTTSILEGETGGHA